MENDGWRRWWILMRDYDEKKRFLHLALVASVLIFLYELGKILNVDLVWEYNWSFMLIVSGFFIAILIVSIVRFVKEQYAPIIVMVLGGLMTFLMMVLVDPVSQPATAAENNFHTYKEGREEIVELVLDGKIERWQPPITDMGQFTVPWGYMDDLYPRDFQGKVYSEDTYFFFFPYDEGGFLSGIGPGSFEGFVYSSLDRPPTRKEFDAGGRMRPIDGPWYYLNSDVKELEKECLTLCK